MLLFMINLVLFETCKGLMGVILVSMSMFSFDMLNIKMILYEQNFKLKLSLNDINNAKQKYQ